MEYKVDRKAYRCARCRAYRNDNNEDFFIVNGRAVCRWCLRDHKKQEALNGQGDSNQESVQQL